MPVRMLPPLADAEWPAHLPRVGEGMPLSRGPKRKKGRPKTKRHADQQRDWTLFRDPRTAVEKRVHQLERRKKYLAETGKGLDNWPK